MTFRQLAQRVGDGFCVHALRLVRVGWMRALAIILAVSLCPGVAEALDDLAHFVAEGHTLHAAVVDADHVDHDGHDGHDEQEAKHGDDEHGCSTLFHVCACHSPAPSMTTVRLTVERAREVADEIGRVVPDEALRAHDGVIGESFRPPIV